MEKKENVKLNVIVLMLLAMMFATVCRGETKHDSVYIKENVPVKLVTDTTYNANNKKVVKYYAVINNMLLNSNKSSFDKAILCKKLGCRPIYVVIDGKRLIVK